jgi:hypothetical protein
MKDKRNNKDKTGYAQHILNTRHTYGNINYNGNYTNYKQRTYD